MSAFSLFHAPQHLTVLLQCMKYAPLPKYNLRHIISIFGELFSSDHFRRPSSIPKGTIQVSCYALFEGWLLLSQPTCCIGK